MQGMNHDQRVERVSRERKRIMGGGAWSWRRAAKKMGFPCASFSSELTPIHPSTKTISASAVSGMEDDIKKASEETEDAGVVAAAKSSCAICLETLSASGAGAGDGNGDDEIFTAQCSHAFHLACIASNVRHGNMTCPICRASWPKLPRELAPLRLGHPSDPALRILDDSIATSRFNRRSSLRSAIYDDDDPVEPDAMPAHHPRLHLAVVSCSHPNSSSPQIGLNRFYLSVRISHQRGTDMVLVASPNGPHLRLLKQSMALVIFSLRPIDRLAIVTYSSAAARAFPLRRMTSHGKRMALQAVDRLFYLGAADPLEGLRKGIKILEDRTHRNPVSCVLHLSDSPARAYVDEELQMPFLIHRFHVGFGFGMSHGFVMHEFEEFLLRLLGGVVREMQLRIEEGGGWMRLGELRGGEERRIPVDIAGESGYVCVGYSYIEGGSESRVSTGEMVVGIVEKSDHHREDGRRGGGRDLSIGGRQSSVERWDYLDPFMARRWAKHLHGYRV